MSANATDVSTRKIVIVGGVAGGMSVAARARRLSEDSEIINLTWNLLGSVSKLELVSP